MAFPAAGGGVWTALLEDWAVRDALDRARTIRHPHAAGEVGSTQDVARDLAGRGAPSGTLVIADHQTAGRGRGGRRWDDHPDGRTLALSVLLDVDGLPAVPMVPLMLGIGMFDAFLAVADVPRGLALKWPNDVVHRADDGTPRKLCGILVERERIPGPAGREVLLCGVGIDVDLRDVEGVADRTCLSVLAGTAVDPGRLLAAVVRGVDAALPLLADPEVLLERYRALSDTIGRTVRVEPYGGAAVVGRAVDVDASGRLIVSEGGRCHAVLSATVRDAQDARGRAR